MSLSNHQDRHGASTNTFPPIDAEQNVKLLGGSESDGWTNIKFERTIAACSGSDDIAITVRINCSVVGLYKYITQNLHYVGKKYFYKNIISDRLPFLHGSAKFKLASNLCP